MWVFPSPLLPRLILSGTQIFVSPEKFFWYSHYKILFFRNPFHLVLPYCPFPYLGLVWNRELCIFSLWIHFLVPQRLSPSLVPELIILLQQYAFLTALEIQMQSFIVFKCLCFAMTFISVPAPFLFLRWLHSSGT